jgi:Do/DeqQ family serine protease
MERRATQSGRNGMICEARTERGWKPRRGGVSPPAAAVRPALLAALAAFLLLAPASAGAETVRQVPSSEVEVTLSFAPVVRRVVPAVVNVYASRLVATRSLSPFFDDPFFRRFFGDGGGGPRQRMQSSLGSGVIVEGGLVVTNNHVIENADEVRVALADRREFDADVVLKDEGSDLAVLKIRAAPADLPTVPFGESDALEVGDIVLAVGNPFGVGQTVTQGIVSAVARTQVGITDYQFFIQTDAAINPGNSGGALVDMAGRLVGINTAIFSRGGGSNGIGFAIPANMVRLVVDAARTGSVVRRPWFGATLQVVTAEIAESLGLDRPRGAIVTTVHAGGPAAEAGLRAGDVVVAVDGVAVDDPDAFGYRFTTRGTEGETPLTIVRDGRERTVTVRLGPPPETVPRDERMIGGYAPLSGATVMNLSPAVGEELKLPSGKTGVVVAAVTPGSPAASIGFAPGDVVVEVNGERVDTTRTLEQMMRERPGTWRLVVDRGGELLRLALRG